MPDEIKDRLQSCSDTCIKSYEAWRKDEKSGSAREALQESIHEIRKVASRLEIELAVSERDQMAQKPIPIPSHRNSQGKPKGQSEKQEQKDAQPKKSSKKPASKGGNKKTIVAGETMSLGGTQSSGGEEE